VKKVDRVKLRRWRRRGFYSESALVKLLQKNNYNAVRVPVSNPSLHPLPDVIARRDEDVYAFEVKNASYYAYFPKQQMDKLFRFLDELIPIPNKQKHAVLAAHLGKRWLFKELKWEDWANNNLPEQERILKRDKGNFDFEKGEKKTKTHSQDLPGLVFDKMGQYWDILSSARDTEKEIALVEKLVENNGKILDLCCGTGRHDILLMKKGWEIIGADFSDKLLRIAKNKMRKESVSFPLVRCEMQYLPFRDEAFSAVINMFTSFGYLPSEKEDLISLGEIARTLKLGGKFLLDIANRDHLLKVFKENDIADFETFAMEEKRSLDEARMKMTSQWTVTRKDTGERLVLEHRLRLYTFETFSQMSISKGLTPKAVYGNYLEETFTPDSSRLIILAEKQHAN